MTQPEMDANQGTDVDIARTRQLGKNRAGQPWARQEDLSRHGAWPDPPAKPENDGEVRGMSAVWSVGMRRGI